MKARLLKKQYKAALTRFADKIPLAFSGKKDRKRWISEVTNLWVRDRKEKQHDTG